MCLTCGRLLGAMLLVWLYLIVLLPTSPRKSNRNLSALIFCHASSLQVSLPGCNLLIRMQHAHIESTMVTYMMWVHSQRRQSKNVPSLQVLQCRPGPKPCLG